MGRPPKAPTIADFPDPLIPSELAAIFKITRDFTYDRIRRGVFPKVENLGGKILVQKHRLPIKTEGPGLEVLLPEQAAKKMRMSMSKLRSLIGQGRIKTIPGLGRIVRIQECDLPLEIVEDSEAQKCG